MNRVTGTHREHGRPTPLRPPLRAYDLRSGADRPDRRGRSVAGLALVAAGGSSPPARSARPTSTRRSGPARSAPPPAVMVPAGDRPVRAGLRQLAARSRRQHGVADGERPPVALEPGGAFTILIPQGTTESASLATGPAGASRARRSSPSPTRRCRPTYPATAALHVQAADWANPAIRQQVLDLAAQRPHQRRAAGHQGRGRRRRLRQRRPAGGDRRGHGGRPLRRPPGARRAARHGCAGDRADRLLPRPGAGEVGVGERSAAT